MGTYSDAYVGDAVVVSEGGALQLKLGPGGKKSFPLKHFDRDMFLYYPYHEMPELPVPVSFQIGPDQKAAAVTIDDLNDVGLGVLQRKAE